MIKRANLEVLMKEIDFVPQAIIGAGIFDLAKHFDFEPVMGQDDLDEFWGAAFVVDGHPFALMQYRGHKKDTSTIYLPYQIESLEEISKVLNQILSELKLADKLVWQRSDDFKNEPPKSSVQ
jgi:hypothetical protein